MEQLGKQLGIVVMLGLALTGPACGLAQASRATIHFTGNVNPGATFRVTATPADASLSVYSPADAGVSCDDAGFPDLGDPLQIVGPTGVTAPSISSTGKEQSITLSAPVKVGDRLCLRVTGTPNGFGSTTVISPIEIRISFASQPVGGSKSISVIGDDKATVAVYQFPAAYASQPKSEYCSAADYPNGQVIALGSKDPTTHSIKLNGSMPFTIPLNKPLVAATQLCLYAVETASKAPAVPTPYYSPFATVAAAPPPPAQIQPKIDPAPNSSDLNITLITGTAAVGDTITLFTGKTAESCSASDSPVALLENSSHQVIAGGKTTVVLQKPSLVVGYSLCAVIANAAGDDTLTTSPVAVAKPPAPVAALPSIVPVPKGNEWNVTVNTATAAVGNTISILTAAKTGSCASGNALDLVKNTVSTVQAVGGTTTLQLQSPLASGQIICAETKDAGGTVTGTTPEVVVGPGCRTTGIFTDCTFEYLLIGGIEQADLSAQSSVTEGFYDLFLRRPVDSDWGSIWFRSRYLGTPSSSSTQNIVSAASNPTGTLTAANLPQSVTAVDYTLGFQFDFGQIGKKRLTYSPIVGFGATTPLSASTTVAGYAVPAYGTNECSQLQNRFGNARGYNPPLPSSGVYDTSGDMGCVVTPNPKSTAANPLPGTQINTIAFSNEDRSSFLLKWGAGVRILDRPLATGSSGCGSSAGCSRLMADFTLGQDQAITGGYLRHLVFKADAIVPVFSTGFYFFASSANRLEKNTYQSPLILSPVTVATSTASTACTANATTVCFPSPSVFVLPYKQQNRDYYRVGVGVDVTKIFTKLFSTAAPAATPATTPATTPAQ
jgi:hypothetical protein